MSAGTAATSATRHLLLVEDEAIVALATATMLRGLGYLVQHAADGAAAVAWVEANPTDLVLMDIDLGSGIDGTEAAQQILSNVNIPIVFLTSHSEKEWVRKVRGITKYGYVLKNSGEFVLAQSIETAFELFDSHQLLAASEARYRTMARNLPNGMVALFDENLTFLMAEGTALEQGPLTSAHFVGKRLREVYPKAIADRDEPFLRKALEGITTDQVVHHEDRYHCVVTAPIQGNSRVRRGLVLTQDVTESKLAEERLSMASKRLDLAISSAQLGVWTRDMAAWRLEWNDELLKIYGLEREEFEENQDVWREMVLPEDLEIPRRAIQKTYEGESVSDFRFRIRRKSGEVRHLRSWGVPIVEDGQVTTVIGINIDATDTAVREGELSNAIAQRETTLRETNHRIKNSLAACSALVSLKSDDPNLGPTLKAQIEALIAAHRSIDSASSASRVSATALLDEILAIHFSIIEAKGASVETEIADLWLPGNVAVPLALTVNELITNAITHGIRDGAGDRVRVSLRQTDAGSALAVSNSGHLIPQNVVENSAPHRGLGIVQALAHQIGGNLTIEREPRSTVTLVFHPATGA